MFSCCQGDGTVTGALCVSWCWTASVWLTVDSRSLCWQEPVRQRCMSNVSLRAHTCWHLHVNSTETRTCTQQKHCWFHSYVLFYQPFDSRCLNRHMSKENTKQRVRTHTHTQNLVILGLCMCQCRTPGHSTLIGWCRMSMDATEVSEPKGANLTFTHTHTHQINKDNISLCLQSLLMQL